MPDDLAHESALLEAMQCMAPGVPTAIEDIAALTSFGVKALRPTIRRFAREGRLQADVLHQYYAVPKPDDRLPEPAPTSPKPPEPEPLAHTKPSIQEVCDAVQATRPRSIAQLEPVLLAVASLTKWQTAAELAKRMGLVDARRICTLLAKLRRGGRLLTRSRPGSKGTEYLLASASEAKPETAPGPETIDSPQEQLPPGRRISQRIPLLDEEYPAGLTIDWEPNAVRIGKRGVGKAAISKENLDVLIATLQEARLQAFGDA